jgi:hypothetical protein
LEMASTQIPVCHLASFLCLDHSLGGNATPLQKLQIGAWTPSYCQTSSQVGTSLEFNRVLSWMHPRCGRFRVNGYVCCIRQPFPNLSRNLSLRAGFLPHLIQRRSIAQCGRVTLPLGSLLHHRVHGPRAVVRCSQVPRWG